MSDLTQAVTEAVPAPAALKPGADTHPPPDVDQLFHQLEARIHELRPNEDLGPLRKAYAFAAARHQGQKRVSGEPFMVHPLLVTRQLADMHMDMAGLVTGLLPDGGGGNTPPPRRGR